ncbi:tRNA synthetases class I-domain-containing protein, partial [Jimgerdemannia flammicorona]
HIQAKYVVHSFSHRRLPIIIDDGLVDPSFGKGTVKITPAHDFNDYEVRKRHNAEFIDILNDDGTLNENAGRFKGFRHFQARRAIVDALKEMGLYIDTKDNPMIIPICSLSGEIIEPLMKPQWLSQTASSRSNQRLPNKDCSVGWAASRTGASRVSCGGVTACQRTSSGWRRLIFKM